MVSNKTTAGTTAKDDELLVALPPEILAMMAASEAEVASKAAEEESAELPEAEEPADEASATAEASEDESPAEEPALLHLADAPALEAELDTAPLMGADEAEMADESDMAEPDAESEAGVAAESEVVAEHETEVEAEVEADAEAGAEPVDADALPAFALAMLAEASAPVEGETVLELPAVLDITAAAGLHGTLLGHRGAPLAVDASAVKRLGGQCLQLLISAGRTWGADGVPIRLTESSEAFQRDLALMGLSSDELFQREAA